jgi:hypothetical protein
MHDRRQRHGFRAILSDVLGDRKTGPGPIDQKESAKLMTPAFAISEVAILGRALVNGLQRIYLTIWSQKNF